jgi:hypothetical protein
VVDSAIWVILIIGVLIGFYLGRWRTEGRRARFDQDRVWDSRANYRK